MNCKTLPPGYRPAGTLDFVRSRRQLKIVAWSGLAAAAVMLACGLLFHPIAVALRLLRRQWGLWFALAGMLIAYIPLHELTHGIFMHALSGARPRYGLRLPYAYAGSDAYFDKRSHGIIALAPLAIWGVALQALCAALPQGWWWLLWAVQISNVSGSVGDIYCVIYLAHMPRDILIRDTGTRMTIYKKRSPATEEAKP